MTPLPPLPLTYDKEGNPCLLIDNSALELLMNCPRKFEYSFLRKRVLANSQAALNFGQGVHQALAQRYKQFGKHLPSNANEVMEAVLNQHFNNYPQPDNDFRSPALAKRLIEWYNKVYKAETWEVVEFNGKPQVEVSFTHELGEVGFHGYPKLKVVLMGRMDLAIKEPHGIWVMDHKTGSVFGEGFWNTQKMLWQCKGYVWAYQQSYGEKPIGYYIDGIRVRPPKKDDEFDPEQGFKRDDFRREAYVVTDDDLTEWKDNILATCEELLFHYSRGMLPRRTTHCQSKYGRCSYCDVCSLPEQSRLAMLASSQYQDNVWSPLNNPDKVEE